LFVRIKNQCWPGKTARQAGAAAVQPDDVKRLAGEAERKARVGRIGCDRRVPLVLRGEVDFMELLQLLPEPQLEFFFA
jgi:hypothetical protein